MRCHGLVRLVLQLSDEQRRFPLQMATVLSQQFAGHGLQFFKVNKTVTHVAAARPHFLDMEAEPVSEGIKRIVHFINAVPKCTRRQLAEGLAPGPAQPPKPEGGQASSEAAEPTAEQTAVIADLHWLIHQGHVMEFANGALETAKRPSPKPPKAAPPTEARNEPSGEPVVNPPEPSPGPPASSVDSSPEVDLASEAISTPSEQASETQPQIDAAAPEEELAQRTEMEVSASGELEAEKPKEETPPPSPSGA